MLHKDDYLGMDEQHPASIRRDLRRQLVDIVHPRALYGIAGDAPDPEAEAERYSALLTAHEPVAEAMGIGENGHIALNDPHYVHRRMYGFTSIGTPRPFA